jgi:tetratricopeptide (TPR) repeat protein
MHYRSIILALCLAAPLAVSAAEKSCSLVGIGTLPVTMSGTQPLVTGTINGIEARFLLDTGADFSQLWHGAIEKFQLKPLPRYRTMKVRGVGGDIVAQGVSAEKFALNGFGAGEIKNVQFIVGGGNIGFNVDGIIGQNVIGSYDSEYDLANGVIRLFSTTGCEKRSLAYWANTTPVAVMSFDPRRSRSTRPISSALLNGSPISILFDSGAARSMLTRKAAERAGVKPGDDGVVSAGISFGISHQRVNTWLARFDMLDLGGEQIKNARLRIGDTELASGADMLLGADFFLSHRVYVAKAQSKVYFTHNGGRVFDLSTTDEGEGGGAIAVANSISTNEPESAAGFRLRGTAFLARNDMRSAMTDFDQAIKLDPSDAENYRQRALAYYKDNKTELAIADFDHALTLKPNWVPVLIERGTAHARVKNTTAVVEDFNQAIAASPGDSAIGIQAATLLLNQNNYSEGLPFLNQWLTTFPKDARKAGVLNLRCLARSRMKQDLPQALTDCDAAVDHKRDPVTLESRGVVWLQLGNVDKSIDDFKAALRMQSKRSSSLYGLGIAKIKQGKKADGQKDIDAAIALSPKVGESFKLLGLEP